MILLQTPFLGSPFLLAQEKLFYNCLKSVVVYSRYKQGWYGNLTEGLKLLVEYSNGRFTAGVAYLLLDCNFSVDWLSLQLLILLA